MKTKLHKTLFIAGLALLGAQAISAQHYIGYPYGGTAPTTSTVPGNSIIIECENFDSTDAAGTNDGANYSDNNATPPAGVLATYNDKSSGNTGNSASARLTGDVDVSDYTDGATGAAVTAVSGGQGQEYQLYTVKIAQDGNYTLSVNYATGGTGKRQYIALKDPSDFSNIHTFLNTDELPTTGNSSTFQDFTSETDGTADLTAGTYVLQSRVIVNGPNYNYITIKTNSVLSTKEFEANAFSIPNPINNNQLTIKGATSKVDKIAVFNILGSEVLSQKVADIQGDINLNVNSLSSGLYILKITGTEGEQLTKKIIKQ